jgi:hypothetical protein
MHKWLGASHQLVLGACWNRDFWVSFGNRIEADHMTLLRNTERGGVNQCFELSIIFSFLSLKTLGYFVETNCCIFLRKQECIQRSYYEFLHSLDVY